MDRTWRKINKIFPQTRTKNSKSKLIKTLNTEKGTVYKPNDILDECKYFYQKLYTETNNEQYETCDCNFFKHNIIKLNDDEQMNATYLSPKQKF